jgi:carboxypeptidase C (cathepsin A)
MVGREFLLGIVAGIGILGLAANALGKTQDEAVEVKAEKSKKAIAPASAFISQHSGRFNGEKIDYTVTAGETYLRDKEGEPKAAIFAFAYTQKDVADSRTRGPWWGQVVDRRISPSSWPCMCHGHGPSITDRV